MRFVVGRATLALALCACGSDSTPTGSSSPDGGPSTSSGSSTSSSSSSSSSGAATSSCNLPLYPSDYDPKCQTAMDAACCEQEKACAADPDCPKLVACINACPAPRTDACVNACTTAGESTPGFPALLAIADCSKGPSYQKPDGVSCGYP